MSVVAASLGFMFGALARGVWRHPLWTLLAWALIAGTGVALAIVGVTGQGLFDRVASEGLNAPDSESARADATLAAADGPAYTMIVSGVDIRDQAALAVVAEPLIPALTDLNGLPEVNTAVTTLVLPGGFDNPAAARLTAADGDGFLVMVTLQPNLAGQALKDAQADLEQRLDVLASQLNGLSGITALFSAHSMLLHQIIDQMEADLTTGELISLPIALLVMVIVFAGFAAAALPLLGALASIASALGAMFGFTYVMELHTSVINVITVVAVGLSIDYGLLIVSRFREESRAGPGDVQAALVATLRTAGRTVTFSALTIAAAIAGLAAFDLNILRAFAIGGLVVVLIALATALTLVPAGLRLLGPRLVKPSPMARLPLVRHIMSHRGEIAPEEGFFSHLASRVQRWPWLVIVLVLVALTVLALPGGQAQLRNSTVELLPQGSSGQVFLDRLSQEFPVAATPAIEIVAHGSEGAVKDWAINNISPMNNVSRVNVTPQNGFATVAVHLAVDDASGPQARAVVQAVRALDAPFDFEVGGQAGRLVDFFTALGRGAPLAGGIVALVTLLLLFGLTGSILIPIKALLSNVVTLLACLGVTTWLFQQGHLSGLLGFQPMAGLESYIVVLLFIFGFGLAMDYEVFLISRIKEGHDAGLGTNAAVRQGLQKSGRIITSAALIIILVFAGFAAGKLIIIKEIGIGLAVTVLIDATLVRMLLVPATMTVLGRWNWAAPKPLRRLHARLHLDH